ncbi:carbohydrate ABC transporter permease [Paenibacillus sp. PAMC21692]|uniref:carbohydrate ABC transporter permease n=1 Tax=Paenibacillus sp. PAMC21692 TaxID=2762320 RepID=UPI00164E58D6|nr:carbohydrate ABC transporter permease [Paenibacillus sp. PAMC21692]QNK60188.1 carbohydrate ABC transporter permease [Paenibacillus sp. PAMC21692]
MNKRSQVLSMFQHGALALMCAAAIIPLYWMVISSLKNESEIFTASLFPLQPTFGNYSYAFSQMPIVRMIFNSFGVSILMTVLQLATGLLAAYALVRWRFRGKSLIFALLSVTWLIPFQAIMIPNYVLINDMGLNETLLGIVLPFSVSTFAILSLYQAFQSFPGVLIEAACIDGLSDWGILTRLILPNIRSTVASLGIIQFINAWNEYLWPMLVTKDMNSAPIQIGLKLFVNSDTNMWGSLMAATTVSCLPILLIYLVLRRQIVDSFIRFGIK